MDDISDIRALYDRDPDREARRLEEHQLEFDLTWKYLEEYLPGSGRILELGCATGRYTVGLAQRGYDVTAVDLSPRMVEQCQANVEAVGHAARVRHICADARFLLFPAGQLFDAVLIMGPLYHLVEEADRRLVLRGCQQVLAPGGVCVSAFITRLGIFGELIRDSPDWIEQKAEVEAVLQLGRDPDHWPKGGFRGYFCRIEELAPLHESEGFETLAVAAVEPAISADDESYNRLAEPQRGAWLDLLFRISREPSILGSSRHVLYVGRKRPS